jgi:hypothetical protein
MEIPGGAQKGIGNAEKAPSRAEDLERFQEDLFHLLPVGPTELRRELPEQKAVNEPHPRGPTGFRRLRDRAAWT